MGICDEIPRDMMRIYYELGDFAGRVPKQSRIFIADSYEL
jgi:hypothetical protein